MPSGHSSVVERLVANEKVEGSTPFARSIFRVISTMSDLFNKKNIVRRGSSKPFNKSEIDKYLKKIDGWDAKCHNDKNYYLFKKFNFKSFLGSQKFVNKVSAIAEKENHHPDISFGWGYCKVKIFTHTIKGLAKNDFILASKIDKI